MLLLFYEYRIICARMVSSGLPIDSPDAVIPSRWRGKNRLGCLMDAVREKLWAMDEYRYALLICGSSTYSVHIQIRIEYPVEESWVIVGIDFSTPPLECSMLTPFSHYFTRSHYLQTVARRSRVADESIFRVRRPLFLVENNEVLIIFLLFFSIHIAAGL